MFDRWAATKHPITRLPQITGSLCSGVNSNFFLAGELKFYPSRGGDEATARRPNQRPEKPRARVGFLGRG